MLSGAVVYDPMDTVKWMMDGIRMSVNSDTVPGADGRSKRKTKAQREAELVRFQTLCELVWNIEGRPAPLDDYANELLAA